MILSRRAVFAALLIAAAPLSAPTAFAAGKADAKDAKEEGDAAPPAKAVDLNHLVMPVAVNGRLNNYLFVSVRLIVADGVDVWAVRNRSHFLRDAIVRAAHKADVAKAGNVDSPDDAAVLAMVRSAVAPIVGEAASAVASILSYDSSSRF